MEMVVDTTDRCWVWLMTVVISLLLMIMVLPPESTTLVERIPISSTVPLHPSMTTMSPTWYSPSKMVKRPAMMSAMRLWAPSICKMLEAVREANPGRPIVMVLDNASNHHSRLVTGKASELEIKLAFMPPYSPQYNPIEQIWKCVKREISKNFIIDKDELFWLIESVFMEKSASKGYAKSWMRKFLPKKMRNRIFLSRVS